MRLPRLPRRHGKKYSYLCLNGPWQGSKLWLTGGNTLPLCINGELGRYAAQSSGGGKVYWEAEL